MQNRPIFQLPLHLRGATWWSPDQLEPSPLHGNRNGGAGWAALSHVVESIMREWTDETERAWVPGSWQPSSAEPPNQAGKSQPCFLPFRRLRVGSTMFIQTHVLNKRTRQCFYWRALRFYLSFQPLKTGLVICCSSASYNYVLFLLSVPWPSV